MTNTVEDIENAIRQLPPDQLRVFRLWYEKFDSDSWDEQIASDAKLGRLDSFADSALAAHREGKSRKL